MQCVPDKIETRNLVAEKLNAKQHNGNCDHPPALNNVEGRGERENISPGKQTEGSQRSVDVQSCRKARSCEDRNDLLAAYMHSESLR